MLLSLLEDTLEEVWFTYVDAKSSSVTVVELGQAELLH